MELYDMCFSLALLVLVSISAVAESTSVGKDGRAVIIDGQRRLIISGAIHYPRSTPGMWPDLMRKAKEGGLNAVETYVFWNGHEPRPGEYYFEGNYDLIRFLREVQNAGLYAILRIGPYVCAEWVYGGIPGWLRQTPGMKFRINNQAFESAMQKFTTLIVNKVKEANLLAGQGGPIILAQIENEYGNIEGSYNWNEAHQYVHWCARMAQDQNINIPWIMCQQDNNPPDSVINTCNGWYCDWWCPARKTIPKMWTENWMSFFKFWGGSEPRRRIEDIAYAVARFYQKEGTLQNYYMYHGGTNFGRTAGGPYITTTYDYYAPLDEYGNIRQPQYGHLKELHSLLMDMEKFIVYGDRTSVQFTGGVWITKWALNGGAACFISNANDGRDVNVTFEGATYLVPAWTVSILPDCTTVAYNTGKVKAQTSVMVNRPNAAEAELGALRWSWMPENLERFMTDAYGSWKANKLLEQATFTYDYTDYMWYMTSVDRDYEEKFNLYVKTFGHGLHAFVNGELVGSKYAPYGGSYEFEFKAPVTLRTGKNYISLLSATVGLRNYGDRFEETPVGIAGGPVKLLGASNNFCMNISGNTWAYKAGLDGEERQVHLDGPHLPWQIGTIPVRRPFTWYKTTFQSPPGIEPVAVDLLGLGKGMAWVNGNSLGRYWVTAIAPNHWPECYVCPKKGSYKVDTSCRFKCGEPSQRWYHVPRSFLNDGEPNTLVLFEENGGDPSHVNFQTVSVGPVCANVDRGEAFTLSCEWGRTISSVDYASFGNVRGECGRYSNGCDSPSAFSIISKACVGKESCTVQYNDAFLQGCNCFEQGPPVLTVQATC